ncbi:ABC transporter permease subunit [Clostridium sp. MCC353]|uniref:ABC transporter permease n=1 Tax=Clostridium sp. MCC353 TaxID=2592646 RepID=UPI001C00B9E6|nr:ABC transporter permease [Clostridium sp. MCC353]MBT9778453.1 ABC transporter permease subunit [Clostridium sp. MCC353]
MDKSRYDKILKFSKTLFSRKIVSVSGFFILLFIVIAVFAPLIAPYDPDFADFAAYLQGPSRLHVLGTDSYGRDVLSRIIYGTRVSLIIGVLAVVIACAVGTFFGMAAGYFGGVADDVINRLTEAVRAIPQVVLAMALTAVFGGGIRNLALILGISSMAGYVRMMRGQVLSIKEADYIMAAKLQGNKNFQLMFKHILPNSISPIIVMMTQQVGNTILSEAGLSFLGLGISAPTASWGSMVSEGRMFLLQNPVFALTPGICVAVLVISLNMFGDGIRDALDPRLRGEI